MTFLLATPVLFVIFAVLLIAIAVSVETERGGWATTFFSLSIALLFWHFWSDIWSWVSLNPVDTAMFVGGYIVGGIVWALIKWKSYISESARHFQYLKEKFNKDVGEIGSHWYNWIKVLNDNRKGLKVYGSSNFYEYDEPEEIIKKITINPSSKKVVIVSWISYWPMSIAATLLNDPIRRFMSYVYERISGVFQRMSVNSTKGLGEGMNKYEKSEQRR